MSTQPGITVSIEGVEFANRQLKQLDEKIRRSVVRKATRRGGNVILKAVRDEAPKRTGALRAAMRLTVDRDRRTGTESAEVKLNRKTKRQRRGRRIIPSKYMHLVTRGAAHHVIKPTKSRALAFGDGEAYGRVNHPGARADDYMGKAYRRSARAGLQTFTREYKQLTQDEINKQAREAQAQ